jgi:integrase/recombinase XerD
MLTAKAYSERTVRNYVQEMRFIFAHFNHLSPQEITQNHLYTYLNFIKTEHGVGRDKCRMSASACSFFFKHILPTPFVIPSQLYPRKEFKLPDILSEEQIVHLLSSIKNSKHQAIIALFYGSGLRLNELRQLKMCNIQRANLSIKVVAGKGNKDRFTLLPQSIIPLLISYYKQNKPQIYLFEGQRPGVAMNNRSIQHAVSQAMVDAGFEAHKYSSHTLRHSFATHLLDNGTDLHTIKELLGHSNLETTMIYLHLSKKRREKIISPLDKIKDGECN